MPPFGPLKRRELMAYLKLEFLARSGKHYESPILSVRITA